MIRLTRSPAPTELTNELMQELTDQFRKSGDDVWNKTFLKQALLTMSHGKCVYCETKLGQESKYAEIDHFHHKAKYPLEVVQWKNLLPACKRCNVRKRDHDTVESPIVDPTEDDPQQHLLMRNYRLRGRDDLGQNTVKVLSLNDAQHLMLVRFEIGERTALEAERLAKVVATYALKATRSVPDENEICQWATALLKEASPPSEFSATVATVLLADENFAVLKGQLEGLGLWSNELGLLEQASLRAHLNP